MVNSDAIAVFVARAGPSPGCPQFLAGEEQ